MKLETSHLCPIHQTEAVLGKLKFAVLLHCSLKDKRPTHTVSWFANLQQAFGCVVMFWWVSWVGQHLVVPVAW